MIEMRDPAFSMSKIRFIVALLPVAHDFQRPGCVKHPTGQDTAEQHMDLRQGQVGRVFLSRHCTRTRKKCARIAKVI